MNPKKPLLTDVVIMRLLLIFLLVVYHAFCIYCGGWNKPFAEFPYIPIYDWIGSLTHEFQLQSMVFISGLLLGYSAFRNSQRLSFDACVLRKAKRLLIPCYVFGIAYWLMFNEMPSLSIAHIGGVILKIANGIGHLWFLPMLFWCFVITYVLERYKLCKPWLIGFCAFGATFNVLGFLPLGLGYIPTYYLFFFIGFMMGMNRINLPKTSISLAAILFFGAFVASMYMKHHFEAIGLLEKSIHFALVGIVNFIMSVTGTYMLYRAANASLIMKHVEKHHTLIKLSGYCYGVYIFQQFILRFFYYNLSFAAKVNAYILPWAAIAITIVLSLLLTHIFLKTRFGRFLIG